MKHTDVVIILDRSGSMSSMKTEVEGGFAEFVREQATLEGTCNVTLVQFDSHEIETVYSGKPIKALPKLVLTPRGGTPLLQAVGQTVNEARARIDALPAKDKPEQVVVIIITDGEENTPREYTLATVKSLIEERRAAGWQFAYLGANVDSFGEAARLGIAVNSASNYVGEQAVSMFRSASASLGNYRSGLETSYTFNDAQRQAMTGTTNVVPPLVIPPDTTNKA